MTHSRVLVVGGAPGVKAPPEQPAAGPRNDVHAIITALNARWSPTRPSTGPQARVLTPFPGDLAHAWRVHRAPVDAFLSLAEGTGLRLALLGGTRAAHVMIAHNLTSGRRRALHRLTGGLRRVDRIVVVSRAQERYLLDEVGLPLEHVRFVYDKVDHRFFAPLTSGHDGYVLSVGAERRDYATLMRAVRRVGVATVIVASSLWANDAEVVHDGGHGVSVRHRVSFEELRRLYDRAAVVVVPLVAGARYAAGVNALLEGMAMRRPVIVSHTPGLEGYLDPEATFPVPPGDADGLTTAIERLLADRCEADRQAGAARAIVEAGRNLDGYVAAIAAVVGEVLHRRATGAGTP